MKTERAIELLHHFKFHGVSHDARGGGGLKLVLEWQDIISQATEGDIVEFEMNLPKMSNDGVDQDTFLFVNMHTLSYDTAIKIMYQTHGLRMRKDMMTRINAEMQKERDSLDQRGIALENAEAQLKDEAKAIAQGQKFVCETIEGLHRNLTLREQELVTQRERLEKEIFALQAQVADLMAENTEETAAVANWENVCNIVEAIRRNMK